MLSIRPLQENYKHRQTEENFNTQHQNSRASLNTEIRHRTCDKPQAQIANDAIT